LLESNWFEKRFSMQYQEKWARTTVVQSHSISQE
jgi:hypothetical protein